MPTTRPFPSPTPLAANPATLLPLGAMLLAGSFSAVAQDTGTEAVKTLKPVTITEKAEEAQGKDSVRATTTSIGKGKQELRDIPQSITVVTEKLVDDRNLDTLKDVLHNTVQAMRNSAMRLAQGEIPNAQDFPAGHDPMPYALAIGAGTGLHVLKLWPFS